ncbi:MAG: hypothetical protein HYS81_03475 [Candidatus Aenigmatarchaeota archaeon]|nr:MAG: hypothetical protein HYS81_03475 [Candidatus Aenigmarchaeota archaeon]
MRFEELRTINSISVTILAAFALVMAALTVGGTLEIATGTSLILSTLTVIILITIYVRIEEAVGGKKR